jgi:hypothetical protein
MRAPFTDKWNSFWHLAFGAISVKYILIIPLFLAYQLNQGKPNDLIYIFEFIVGFTIALLYKWSSPLKPSATHYDTKYMTLFQEV